MELELDKVEEGEAGWQEVVRHFDEPCAKSLATIDTAALIRSVHDVGDAEKEPCPNCGGPVAVRSGRFGPFIACKNYPECKYTKPLKGKKAPDRPTDEICRECQSPMVIKTGRFGEFLACSTYPKCKHTRVWSLSRVRLLGMEPAGGGQVPRLRQHRRRGQGHQGARQLPQVSQVRQ
jgi:DNA topoisomerase-1